MALRMWMTGLVLVCLVSGASAAGGLVAPPVGLDSFESLSAPLAWLPASPLNAWVGTPETPPPAARTFNDATETSLAPWSLLNTLPVSPVPEPEPYAMVLAGLGLIGTIARRRTGSLAKRHQR